MKRNLAVFAWRKPALPSIMHALLAAILVLPTSFIVAFGVLPTFGGWPERGIMIEAGYAWGMMAGLIQNVGFDLMASYFDGLPQQWRGADWITSLAQSGLLPPVLFRLAAVLAASLWVVTALGVDRYRRTQRTQGYEYVSGPQIWEGTQAVKQARLQLTAELKATGSAMELAPGIPLSKERELLSFALIGTQGSGKSTVVKSFLPQILAKADRLVVLDQKGDLTETWPSDDVIFFAPHDKRSKAWDIGADIAGEAAAQEFASVLVPSEGADSVWPLGARQIAEAVIIALQRAHGTNWGFFELMATFQSSPLALRELVEPVRPDVLNYMGITEDGEFTKTSIGYVTNLLAAATPLLRPLAISWGNLDRADRVSLTDWVRNPKSQPQTLILQNCEDFPEVSGGWMRQVIKKLVRTTGSSRLPDDPNRRIWFVLDEFVQLGEMPDLLKVPETHRSKGVTLLLTAQSISQIYSTYREHKADILLDLMNTKIIMRTGQGGDTAKRLNAWIGKLRWRDPADTGITETGVKAIPEHEDDLLTQSYISTLGRNGNGVDGLVIGIGPDVYRVRWPLVRWPKHRVAIDPADWAKQ